MPVPTRIVLVRVATLPMIVSGSAGSPSRKWCWPMVSVLNPASSASSPGRRSPVGVGGSQVAQQRERRREEHGLSPSST